MKYISLLIITFISFNTIAETVDSVEKPFSIGAGIYFSALETDGFDDDPAFIDELGFSGSAISIGYAISDEFAFRGNYFSLEEDDNSVLKSKGFDINLYFGSRLMTHGVKAYVGGGIFNDKWSSSTVSETFTGFQASGGVGYNWHAISLDFILNIREASDYRKFIKKSTGFDEDVSVVTGAILLSYRF